ncbi:LOW QUALITY PROTEIN: cilia- and flagella-associated protein 65-like [Osmia bicornis bicornis]|uniref:LOW QUALITY PROTEIN: cilia- and flagella-associated protein 65-like n=1 Tax=Osmia bicornis bicornis TaxID=1437191 RepID=UPI001EAF29CD|nr:LOW QUALITY PROTEIN: cilia- and flagella-associated protein 65-like [Osmia bicornis bicornis]
MKVIELNYGDVEVGKTAVKTIEIWNESCKEQIYQAQRDPTANPLDHVFHLRSYNWALAAEDKFLCEIRYRPFVVTPKNVDYFMITDTSGSCTKIIAQGSCIGPEVVCSMTKMFMGCTQNCTEVKRRIKLINKSKVAAIFMIDIDEKYQVFRTSLNCGTIAPSSYKYVTITFSPPESGRYTYHLVILILHQEPIIIELHGSSIASDYKQDDMTCLSYSWKETNAFEGYMRDTVNILGELPAVSLSKHYFNFGQADVDPDNIIQRIPHAICFTNHNQSNLLVRWEKDIDGIFTVTPYRMHVRANQSALFELTFNPNARNNLFGRELIASAFFEQQQDVYFPIIISVRVIGHSFPISSNGWIPQYEIPQTVIMPPCVPPIPVYTSFLIKKFGHLPMMFQFVSPPASHFVVKPMLGVIHHNYQIIVVEMIPENKNEQIYIERWTVYFNGNTKNESYIDLKGYAEYANIMFCNNNVLIFPAVMPHCQQFVQLGMRNVTRHKIRYRFYQLPSEFKIQDETGEIDPNDTLFQECSFSPIEPNIDYDFEAQCVLIVIKNDTIVGTKCCVTLRVRGRCEMGFLEAIPNELNFNEMEYNTTKTLFFDLVNVSSVNIYYRLICTHTGWPIGDIKKDVEISPASETAFSGTRKKVTVTITPRTPGFYEFAIEYLLRINYRTDKIVSSEKARRICMVNCMCTLPAVKLKNVCAFAYKQTYSVNISKPFLWKALQINKMNEAMKFMLPGDKRNVKAELFPMILNSGAILLKFIFVNPTNFPVSLIIKQLKRCSCKPYVKKVGISLQRTVIDCVHKDLCVVNPTSKILEPKQEFVIGVELHFTLAGKSYIYWDVNIGHDRHIVLKIGLECLTESETPDYFLSDRYMTFGKIYFGNREPVYKTCWIHNITNKSLPYSVNMNNVRKLNESYCCEVFSCLTSGGIIEANTIVPLVLKFQPRMFGEYQVTIPVTMGDKTSEIILKGKASHYFKSTDFGRTIPPHCACKTELFPAYFNIDCIDMWAIPMHSHVIKMLLVYNNLDYAALAYEWKCQYVPGIISVDIFPQKGIIRPNAVQSFRVKIRTKGQPGRIDLNVPCEFLNASERGEYQRSVIRHDILCKELEGQFKITEKGTFVPEPWIKILKKPEPYCKVLTLRCTIIPIEDEHLRMSLMEQLKATPSSTIYFNDRTNYNITKDENELSIVAFILEGILWDIVNSERFQKMMEESLIPGRNLYYSQLVMDLAERKRLIRRSYISPPLTLTNSIFEKMLFSTVHDEFSLKTSHLVPKEDIRHKNYFKMLPKEKRIDLEQEKQVDDEYDDEFYNIRTRFRVSFID